MVDSKYVKTFVIVPFEQLAKINKDYHKLQNKLKVFTTIQEGLEEIKASKKQGVKLKTLSDFLNESYIWSFKKLLRQVKQTKRCIFKLTSIH